MAFFDHLKEIDPVKLNAFLAKRGDPTEVRAYVERMPVIVCDKKRELRVDGRFLVWWEKFVLEKPQAYIIKIEDLVHCYCSPFGGDLRIYVVLSDGIERMFRIAKREDGERAFREITRYVRGFQNQSPKNLAFTHTEHRWCQLEVSREQLVRVRESGIFTKKITREVLVSPADKILWCTQYTSPDSDGPDDDYLHLFTLDGKIHEIQCESAKEAYGLALKLKSLVPHLLYGTSEEYYRLFKQNPSALLAVAQRNLSTGSIWQSPGNIPANK